MTQAGFNKGTNGTQNPSIYLDVELYIGANYDLAWSLTVLKDNGGA